MYTVPLPGLVALVLTAGACARHPDGVTPAPDFPTTADAVDCARAALADAGFHPQTSSDAPTPTSISGRIVSGRKWDRVTANAHVRTSAQGDTTVVLTVTATPANLDGPAAVFLESTVVTVALPALGRDFGSMPPVHIIGSWACPAPARLRAPTRPGSFSPAPP